MRARRPFGNRDDDRFTGPGIVFTQRHAPHLQINGHFLLINGEERQIHSVDIAFPDGSGKSFHAGGANAGLGARHGGDDMGCGHN
jgi:hypothetical protein